MADPASKTSGELEHERIWVQGDLVIQGFRRLIRKYVRPSGQGHDLTTIEDALSTLSIDDSNLGKETRLNQLESRLLPTLNSQITDLSESLKPLGLLEELEPKLRIVSQIQVELERNVDEIISFISLVCPEPLSTPNRFDDQLSRQFKSYRLHSLKEKFGQTTQNIILVFREGYKLLEKLKSSPEEVRRLSYEEFPGAGLVKQTTYTIDWAIECIKGTELDVAQHNWMADFDDIDQMQTELRMLIDPHVYENKRKLRRQKVIHLARLLIGLIKILKLFFTKLSKRGMRMQRLPSFTEMCSEQIESLAQSLRHVTSDLGHLMILLYRADDNQEADSGQIFVSEAANLKSRFHAPLANLVLAQA
ncbi:hypothetical protein PtB15_1B537 [Puccinia triticina]|nr:hypothetical protein PtB15_1B537 [Puccinia triticina]